MFRRGLFFFSFLAIFAGYSPGAQALTFNVDNLGVDAGDDDFNDCICDVIGGAPLDCTIRAAVEQLMNLPVTCPGGSPPVGPHTINFVSPGTAVIESGDILIDDATVVFTINGVANDLSTIERTSGTDRIFLIIDGTVTFNRVAIIGGMGAGGGGAAAISGSSTDITFNDCEFEGNQIPASEGGAIRLSDEATLELNRCTFFQNQGPSGGAIAVLDDGTTLTAINSTFFDNVAFVNGGAIAVFGDNSTVDLQFVTIAGNNATILDGGGIWVEDADPVVTLTSSIIGDNTDDANTSPDCFGDVTIVDTNLIENIADCNPNGTSLIVQDPNLGSFGLNGAPPFFIALTRTIPLLSDSPALDGETVNCSLGEDQRGNDRPQDGNFDGNFDCDLGAHENTCGDGFVDPGETCDTASPPNKNRNGDGCDDDGQDGGNCTPTDCGNGVFTATNPNNPLVTIEECDDGNNLDNDGCDSNCTLPACGNNVVNAPFEECDDGDQVDDAVCDRICQFTGCGNGIFEAGEECDDSNTANGDGCSSDCDIESCGNGQDDPGEACDDGNLVDGDGCSAACQDEVCGDGAVQAGEACDGGSCCAGNCSFASGAACGNGGTCDGGGQCIVTQTQTVPAASTCSLSASGAYSGWSGIAALLALLGAFGWRRLRR